jgi:glycosyltransferase involved in cell wall biosynthesis
VSPSANGFHLVLPGPPDQRTGGYLYDARIVSGLRAEGWDVTVHSVQGRFPDADALARSDLDRVLASIDDRRPVVLDGLAMGGLPDVVRTHEGRLTLVSLLHHPLADETGLTPDDRLRFQALETESLRHVVGVVVTSPFTAARLADFDVARERIRVVVPGTEPAPPAHGPPEGAPPALLCVGSLSPRKGHDVLVEALDRIRDLQWTCTCAGSTTRDRHFADSVRARVDALALTDRIRFVGELDAVALGVAYDAASLFVLPSYYEGYGMAFAEALARGLPVVGTTGGAIGDTVPAGAGILVEPGDVSALAESLRELIDSPERRGDLASVARRHAETMPTWQTQARAFGSALINLVGP